MAKLNESFRNNFASVEVVNGTFNAEVGDTFYHGVIYHVLKHIMSHSSELTREERRLIFDREIIRDVELDLWSYKIAGGHDARRLPVRNTPPRPVEVRQLICSDRK